MAAQCMGEHRILFDPVVWRSVGLSLCLCLSGVESRCDLCGEQRQQDGASMPQVACMACILHGHCDCACAVVTGWAPDGERPHHLDRGPCTMPYATACAPDLHGHLLLPSIQMHIGCCVCAVRYACTGWHLWDKIKLGFPLGNKNNGE